MQLLAIFLFLLLTFSAFSGLADEQEITESGNPIYRHEEKNSVWQVPEHSGRNLESIQTHVEQHIGEISNVYHEILSDRVHVDVLFVPATNERPYHALVTSGVSDLAMAVPEGLEGFNRVELLIALPQSWPLSEGSFNSETNYWPIRWLKQIGRLPHDYNTWIGWGHTIPNGDPAEPIANTDFIGVMLAPAYWLGNDFYQLKGESGDSITFYALIPLFQEEMDLKLKVGADEIEERFEQLDIGFVLDPARKNVAATEVFLHGKHKGNKEQKH